VKQGLREIASESASQADWQPHVLVFTKGAERRTRVLRFASWITGGSGLVTAVSLVEGEGTSEQARRRCEEAEAELRAEIDEQGLDIYPLAVGAPDLRVATSTLLQTWGVGPIRSNTILLNWLDSGTGESPANSDLWYGRLLAGAIRLEHNVIALDTDGPAWERLTEIEHDDRRIDVWWFDDESSRLMLLLAHLMTRTDEWEDATIRVLALASAREADRSRNALVKRLGEARIDAIVEVVAEASIEDLVGYSGDAALVYIPLRIEGMRLRDAFGWGIDAVLPRLPIVALVAAAQDVRISEQPEEAPSETASPLPADETHGKSFAG
jgi:hypothetical protein